MIEWFYLAFGFALVSIFLKKKAQGVSQSIWFNSLRLFLALGILMSLDYFLNHFLWNPLGKTDSRVISLFFLGFLISQLPPQREEKTETPLIANRFFLALTAFAFWMVEKETSFSLGERLLWGFALVPATAIFEWLLEGLRERLRLAPLPEAVKGPPVIFWLAMLLFLAFWGFRGVADL